ncbi:ABC transporter substrate-binding protein [Algibacter sp.]|nr:CmpA/NrtA family ABC transporter substrate-binding protein [Algibacter sp.]MDB4274020.1 ABC transporter substrate-binding protein [Algibacter sp.]
MPVNSLDDPFNENSDLSHGAGCGCKSCHSADIDKEMVKNLPQSDEEVVNRFVETSIVKSIFGGNDLKRRQFIKTVGSGTFRAALLSVIPLTALQACVNDTKKKVESGGETKAGASKLEKTKLNIGFVPITCATPIIMSKPMGFYEKYGLDVDVIKTAGWAVARDKSLNKEYDASHMLTPMPLAMTMGAGSTSAPYVMPAVENINGQAICLHNKHKDKRDPKMWKGFKFGVPFEYSMHNFLLRYYVAEYGLDPDKDIQIRVVPPPEMVANLRAGNLDGYLSPDPFNQRAVYENIGFLHMLTKDIWEGHPCCAFACSQEFVTNNPNTYAALFSAIIDATQYSSKTENRAAISQAIAPKNYLNQPASVIAQVLTGKYADGLGNVLDVPDRIDFDPFPWHSMGVWILTQMKRWGYVKDEIDYKKIAEQVYLAAECGAKMKELGYESPSKTYKKHVIMGKEFDPDFPEEYLNSFEIGAK